MPLRVSEPFPHVTQIAIDNPTKRNAMSRDDMAELARFLIIEPS